MTFLIFSLTSIATLHTAFPFSVKKTLTNRFKSGTMMVLIHHRRQTAKRKKHGKRKIGVSYV